MIYCKLIQGAWLIETPIEQKQSLQNGHVVKLQITLQFFLLQN